MSDDTIFPDSQAIQHAMALISTMASASKVKMAIFLLEKFNKKFEGQLKKNEPAIQEMQQLLHDLQERMLKIDSVESKTNAKVWMGSLPAGKDELNFYEQFASVDIKDIKPIRQLKMDYAINNQGQFLRGYSSNNQVLDGDNTFKMDALFNGWLVSHQLHNQDGVIYKTDINGVILLDANRRQQVVDTPDFINRFEDSNQGFLSYAQKLDNTMQLSIVKQDHPSEQATPSK